MYLLVNFFQLFLGHGKDIIAVSKDENLGLPENARALFSLEKTSVQDNGKPRWFVWGIEGLEC